ncbi:MAG: hypothetical protein KJ927_14330, partial [Candidatus Eisenbacteria bacterium]|nr:hypothetical protein [Candidatus Eisenbacteria bacterium]
MRSFPLYLILISIACAGAGPAPAQDILWTQTFGGGGYDYAESMEQTTDGGFIIAGYGSSFAVGSWDVYLIKTDESGDTLWTRTYGDVSTDVATGVTQTADGGYAVSMTEGIGNLLRVDASGDSLWTRDYEMQAYSVQATTDGGYIIAGRRGGHCYLVKTDADGDAVWRNAYPGGEYSVAFSVAEVSGGGYVTGGSAYTGIGDWDYHIVRTAEDGTQLWNRTYGRVLEPDEGWALCESDDDGFVITGLFFATLKVDAAGDSVWSCGFGTGEIGCALSISPTLDQGFLVGGYVNPYGLDEGEYYLVRIDGQGHLCWERYYGAGDGSFDHGFCARPTQDGAYAMVGWSDAFGAGDMDIWLLRINVEGSSVGAPDESRARPTLIVPSPSMGSAEAHLFYLVPEPCR